MSLQSNISDIIARVGADASGVNAHICRAPTNINLSIKWAAALRTLEGPLPTAAYPWALP